MVTQRSPAYSQTPPKVPVQPQQSIRDPGVSEPGENAWEEVASPNNLQASNPSNLDFRREATPEVLRPGGSSSSMSAAHDDENNAWDEEKNRSGGARLLPEVPDSLIPGGKTGGTNPFLRKPIPQTSTTSPPVVAVQPVAVQPVAESFSKLDISEPQSNHNPWQSAMDVESSQGDRHPPSAALTDMGTDPWARSAPESPSQEQPTPPPPRSPAMVSIHSEGSGWEDAGPSGKENIVVPARMTPLDDNSLLREEHVWDDQNAPGSATGKAKAVEYGDERPSTGTPPDDWNLVDAEPSSGSPQNEPQPRRSDEGGSLNNEKPPLPPRSPGEKARWISSRFPANGSSETYQVKNIQWYDGTSATNPRVSPILIQNENGPCPLVALVNALTLTTPEDGNDTILVQVLRSREQISLGLLLDAVFDELMSPRRTTLEDSLPDVSDLYAFLQSLHTGMNVNPRFIPSEEMVNAFKHTKLTHLDPTERGSLVPGTFENTLEMGLYAAFSIPLIHGWLPREDDPAYAAMERHAASSYEDVQNLLFREEELEHKLSSDMGLTEAEQNLYQDIVTIRMFLESSATQLTPWGIRVIRKAMRPGTFAILFRNDHFATLYRHPETLRLYTLVTDAGYKSHDDIVWESLLDVNGELNEYLAGNFGAAHGPAVNASSSSHNHSEEQGYSWAREAYAPEKTKAIDDATTSVEQEDRDLALALQLQEEEEQKHRLEQARRKRESLLSERFIEQQARRPVPVNPRGRANLVPQRTSSSSVNGSVMGGVVSRLHDTIPRHSSSGQPLIQQVRPLVPPRRQGVNRAAAEDSEPPPPTYEQAAQVPPYIPPPGHPNHPGSTPIAIRRDPRADPRDPRTNAGSVAMNQHAQRPGGGSAQGRRPAMAAAGAGAQSRGDRECVIM